VRNTARAFGKVVIVRTTVTETSAVMSQEKYIGMDVHQATISVAVMDSRGKLIMECILETKPATILEFIQGARGSLSVTFEEGTSAAWLHDPLKPHVNKRSLRSVKERSFEGWQQE
jgi:hypothetical protein